MVQKERTGGTEALRDGQPQTTVQSQQQQLDISVTYVTHVTDLNRVSSGSSQELLRTHGLLEDHTGSRTQPQDRARRRERLTERQKLHQLKRDHELQENTKRKVLRLEEGLEGDASSGSDGEGASSSKKRKDGSEQTVDIQVSGSDSDFRACGGKKEEIPHILHLMYTTVHIWGQQDCFFPKKVILLLNEDALH